MRHKHKYLCFSYLCLIILLFSTSNLISQTDHAIVIFGSHTYTQGYSSPDSNQTIYVKGNFVSETDNAGSNGTVEQNGSNIYVTGDWINESNYKVFNDIFTSNNKDGYVTLNGNLNPQFILGNTPTHFENLILESSVKFLSIDTVEVNGTLHLKSPFHLNGNNLVIDNPLNTAINYLSGYIKSETLPGNLGFVHWKIGNNTGNYSVPFGSEINSFSNNLNLELDIITPMQNDDYISFATYPTDKYNYPLPDFTSSLQHDITKVVDRFWVIKPNTQIGKPDINISFKISQEDINSAFNNINPDKLKAIRYNSTLNEWVDIEPLGSSIGNVTRTGLVEGANFYDNWTLVHPPPPTARVYVPNAFSPDGDGINDEFIPVFHTDYIVEDYDFIIYDRNGNQIFHTTNKDIGWDGTISNDFNYNSPVVGVYTWVILVSGRWSDQDEDYNFSRKYVGKITLVK